MLCFHRVGLSQLFEIGHGHGTAGCGFGGRLDENDMFESADVFWKILYFFVNLRLGNEQDIYPAVLDDIFPGLNELRLVHGNKSRDSSVGGESGDRPLHAVIGDDADHVRFPEAEPGQAAAKVVDTTGNFLVSDPFINTRLVLSAEKFPIGEFGNAFFPQINQIVRLV